MSGQNKEDSAMRGFEAVSQVVKEEVFAALEAHDFEKGRRLTSLMEELVGLQQRVRSVLGGRLDEVQPIPSKERSFAVAGEDYPRFFRRGSLLVKQGERRGGEGIYEQKVPQETYDEILQQLRAVRGKKSEFRPPELLNRCGCPDYQVYLVLNVLQKADYLESPQRGLYRFVKHQETPWAASLWERLPEQHGSTH